MSLPSVELRSTHYRRDGSFVSVEAEITEIEQRAMDMCFELGEEALKDANPPVGAVLIDHERGLVHGARTVDKTEPNILGHAEIRAYSVLQPDIGKHLRGCTLVTTAQLCNTCTAPYAEGKIGRIVYAAPRWAVFKVCGLMRPRQINMHDLLVDGDTDTVVTEGYGADRALASFAIWGALREQGKVQI